MCNRCSTARKIAIKEIHCIRASGSGSCDKWHRLVAVVCVQRLESCLDCSFQFTYLCCCKNEQGISKQTWLIPVVMEDRGVKLRSGKELDKPAFSLGCRSSCPAAIRTIAVATATEQQASTRMQSSRYRQHPPWDLLRLCPASRCTQLAPEMLPLIRDRAYSDVIGKVVYTRCQHNRSNQSFPQLRSYLHPATQPAAWLRPQRPVQLITRTGFPDWLAPRVREY